MSLGILRRLRDVVEGELNDLRKTLGEIAAHVRGLALLVDRHREREADHRVQLLRSLGEPDRDAAVLDMDIAGTNDAVTRVVSKVDLCLDVSFPFADSRAFKRARSRPGVTFVSLGPDVTDLQQRITLELQLVDDVLERLPHYENPSAEGPGPARTTAAGAPTIVLITANDHETDALVDAYLGTGKQLEHDTRGGVTYNLLGSHGGTNLVHTICQPGSGGIGASQQRTRDAIEHWKPVAVIAVGIAFGMNEKKQSIGDVLVSKQVQNYDVVRQNQNGTVIPRGDKSHASDALINRIEQVDASRRRQKDAVWPKVRPGLILSGEKLVDDVDYRDSLKALHPEAIGGEMEANGLYVSATGGKTGWIVVKAICDWGYNKNNRFKERRQKAAARNAVQVLKASLDLGPLSI